MAQFMFPDWPTPNPEPAPSPDPAMIREQNIADATRAEEGLNQFLAARRDALFEAPDAFYRTQGSDAIHAAPAILSTLAQLKDQSLDALANDNQRSRLGAALDAHLQLDREDITRHVAEQSLAWQRRTAQDRIDELTKTAALHHNDNGLVDAIASAAANAARAHARVGDTPPDTAAEDAVAAKAQSSVFNAAIQAQLDRGNTGDAATMLDRLKDQLDPEHAAELGAQLSAGQRFDAAKAYATQLVPQWPDGSHDAVDAYHAAATQRNQTDNQAVPAYQADVQRVLDVQHALQKRGIDEAAAQRAQAVADWLARTSPDGGPQTSQPPPSLRNRLTPDEQAALDKQLVVNARGPMPTANDVAPISEASLANDRQVLSDVTPSPVTDGQQYAQVAPPRDPSRRIGLGERDQTIPEQTRRDFFNLHREELEKLEPDNPKLSYVAPKGQAPTQQAVDEMAAEAAAARARASARVHAGGEGATPELPAPTADGLVRQTVPGGLADKQAQGALRPRSPTIEGVPPRRIGDNSSKFPESEEKQAPPSRAPNLSSTSDWDRYGFTVRYPTPELDPQKQMLPISRAEKEGIANVMGKIAKEDFRGLGIHRYDNDPHPRTGAVLPSSQYGYIAVDIPGVGSSGRGEGRFVVEKVTGKAYYSNVHYRGFVPIDRDNKKGIDP